MSLLRRCSSILGVILLFLGLLGIFLGGWETVLSASEDGRFGSIMESAYSL